MLILLTMESQQNFALEISFYNALCTCSNKQMYFSQGGCFFVQVFISVY